MSTKKTALVILSENFKDQQAWDGYRESTARKITGDGHIEHVINFHNKKTHPKNDLVSKIERCPDVVIFHKCDPATIKKTIQSKCSHLQKVSFFSISSTNNVPGVKEVENFYEIFDVPDVSKIPPKVSNAKSYVGH